MTQLPRLPVPFPLSFPRLLPVLLAGTLLAVPTGGAAASAAPLTPVAAAPARAAVPARVPVQAPDTAAGSAPAVTGALLDVLAFVQPGVLALLTPAGRARATTSTRQALASRVTAGSPLDAWCEALEGTDTTIGGQRLRFGLPQPLPRRLPPLPSVPPLPSAPPLTSVPLPRFVPSLPPRP